MSTIYYPPSSAPGLVTFTEVGTVAAGANPLVTIPVGRVWRFLAVFGNLTCSAVAGTRQPFARARTATPAVYGFAGQSNIIGAGAVAGYSWNVGLSNPATSIAAAGIAGLWNYPMPPGHQLEIVVVGMDPGDQWTSVRYLVEEWFLSP